MSWDFGRYTVESAFRGFAPYSFTTEDKFKKFKKSLSKDQRNLIKSLVSNLEIKSQLDKKKKNGENEMAGRSIEQWITKHAQLFEQILGWIKELFPKNKWTIFQEKFLPFLHIKYTEKEYPKDSLDSQPIKRWIVKRAFELGYDADKHCEFDDSIWDIGRHENNVERIGKKYQWIALHEIVARIADNFKFKEENWSSKSKFNFYQGPWQQYLRDIDPVYTTLNPKEDSDDDELQTIRKPNKIGWWFDATYSYWNQSNSNWIKNPQDLPLPQNIIYRKDDFGIEWVYLKMNCNWEEPKLVGQDKYNRQRKEIWYMFNSYLIHKKDRKKLIDWLGSKNFFGRWMPENHSAPICLFNRENYWSPVSKMDHKERKVWADIEGAKQKVIVTTGEATGEMSNDRSEAHTRYDMPSKTIFEGMGLQYAPEDGNFKNSKGEIVVSNINPRGVLVRKNDLFEFLDQNEYEIIWTLLGEKNHINDDKVNGNNYFMAINGVYYFDKKIEGKLSLSMRE